jgi:MFS family permease
MTTTETPQPRTRWGRFGPLQNRDFRLYWAGACVSFVGSWVQIVAMGLLVYRLTGSKAALGLIGLAGGLPTTALMLFGGVIADRVNKRSLVLMTQSIFAATAFTLAALTWTGHIRIWHIVALSFVNGLTFAADGPARQAMLYDLVGKEELASGVALQSAAFNVARVVGPAGGSLLYAGLGPEWCFLVNGLSFAAIITAIFSIRTDLRRRGEMQGSVWVGFLEGLRHLRSNRLMRSVVSLTAVTSIFAFSAYSTLMPALAREMLDIPENDSRYGLLFSAIGIGSLTGALMVGRFAAKGRRGLLMITGAGTFAVGLFGLSQARNLWLAAAMFMVIGLSAISQLATANTLTQSLAPERLRGRAVSTHMFAMAGLQPVGAFLAGNVAQHWGVPRMLMLGASVLALFALGMLLMRPEVAKLE